MTRALIGITEKNRSLHEVYSTKIDESTGPETPAIAVQNAHRPIAVASKPDFVSQTMIAMELTPSPAKAAACIPRPTIRKKRLGATALNKEPTIDIPAELIMIRLWP